LHQEIVMSTAQKAHPLKTPPAPRFENAIGSAAGAIMRAEDVALMLDAPDEEVGRLLKEEVRRLRSELRIVVRGRADFVAGGTREVALKLPVEQDFPEGNVSDSEVRAEALENRRKLVAAGELLTSAELQNALSMTRQALSFATREKRFFKVEVDGQEYYPAFFTGSKVDRRVLEGISKELGALPGWTKWAFFTTRRDSLGRASALDALARGKEALVREIAQRFLAEETA
jgi:hypothetical protein